MNRRAAAFRGRFFLSTGWCRAESRRAASRHWNNFADRARIVRGIGVVGVVGSVLATVWNVAYNALFDLAVTRRYGTTRKSTRLRLVHAVLFEVGLLLVLMPFLAWYLEISLWRALQMDLAFALFYVVFAYVFGWLYDRIFPLPEWKRSEATG